VKVRVFAPAKINLTLEVGPPKPRTGRHPLQSVIAFADVGDWIEAAPADALSLRIDGPFRSSLPPTEENLVLRAARALSAAAGGAVRGAALRLQKNLPVASGVGGGSSDAAATLKALNQLWRLRLSTADLLDIARPLGGDAPVCVLARSAYMTGEGEQVSAMELPILHAVLVNPGVAVSTAEVFRRFDACNDGAAFTQRLAPDWRSLSQVCAGIAARGNMLMPPACVAAPEIGAVITALQADKRVRGVAMSGSGATVFALTEGPNEALALAEAVALAHPNWWVAPTRLGALDGDSQGR
jgi:4-diphosphocytidyl-2-C-methyl-D-erythritol kinase